MTQNQKITQDQLQLMIWKEEKTLVSRVDDALATELLHSFRGLRLWAWLATSTVDSWQQLEYSRMPHAACRMRDPVLTSCTAKITQLSQRVVVQRKGWSTAACLPASAGRALHHHVASLSPHAKKCARVLGIIKLIVLISVRLWFLLPPAPSLISFDLFRLKTSHQRSMIWDRTSRQKTTRQIPPSPIQKFSTCTLNVEITRIS